MGLEQFTDMKNALKNSIKKDILAQRELYGSKPLDAVKVPPAEQLQRYAMVRESPEVWGQMLQREQVKLGSNPLSREIATAKLVLYMQEMEGLRASGVTA